MSYRVEFTDVADMEVENILLWIMGRAPERAERWQDGLEKAVQSLEEFPGRCALVPEVSTPERQVRQLLYGAYRLFSPFWTPTVTATWTQFVSFMCGTAPRSRSCRKTRRKPSDC